MFRVNYIRVTRHNGVIIHVESPMQCVFLSTKEDCAEFKRLAESLPISPKEVKVGPPIRAPWVIGPSDVKIVLEKLTDVLRSY